MSMSAARHARYTSRTQPPAMNAPQPFARNLCVCVCVGGGVGKWGGGGGVVRKNVISFVEGVRVKAIGVWGGGVRLAAATIPDTGVTSPPPLPPCTPSSLPISSQLTGQSLL